jgi:cysteine synthase B
MITRQISPLQTALQSTMPSDLESQIGNTPLIRLRRTAAAFDLSPNVALFAKAEWFNPSGSVKDRAALSIIRTAETGGQLTPGMTILDSTSGNMGIAYAMIGAARGYNVKLTLPGNVNSERIAVLKAYGAELIFTDPMEGSDGAIAVARRIAADDQSVFYGNQYNNSANWRAHYLTTAMEIWHQSSGTVTHFIAGLGTSGTFSGTSRRLRELNTRIRCLSVQPDGPFHGLEGLKHMESAVKPGIYDERLADENILVRTEDAHRMTRFLARREGLFVGISAGAATMAAINAGRRLDSGVLVTILPDSGMKYLSERFWTAESEH